MMPGNAVDIESGLVLWLIAELCSGSHELKRREERHVYVWGCDAGTMHGNCTALSVLCVNSTLNVKAMCGRNTYRSHPLGRTHTHVHTHRVWFNSVYEPWYVCKMLLQNVLENPKVV